MVEQTCRIGTKNRWSCLEKNSSARGLIRPVIRDNGVEVQRTVFGTGRDTSKTDQIQTLVV